MLKITPKETKPIYIETDFLSHKGNLFLQSILPFDISLFATWTVHISV
jgi:hypothetical protein